MPGRDQTTEAWIRDDTKLHAGWDDYVVPAFDGSDGQQAIDPNSTSNPIQDAIDKCDTNGGGTVYLPPGSVDTPGNINPKSGVDVIGHNIIGTTVNVTNDNPAFVFSAADEDNCRLGNFEIKGVGSGSSSSFAIRYTNKSVEEVTWLPIQVDGWAGVEEVTAAAFHVTHDVIRMTDVDASSKTAAFDLAGAGPAWTYRNVFLTTTGGSNSDGFNVDGSDVSIRALNVGGDVGRAIIHSGGGCLVGALLYESSPPSAPNGIVQHDGGNSLNIRHFHHKTGTVDAMLNAQTNPTTCIVDFMVSEGTVSSSLVVYDADISVGTARGEFGSIGTGDVTLNNANLSKTADKGVTYVTT